jgi:hypothetical protein
MLKYILIMVEDKHGPEVTEQSPKKPDYSAVLPEDNWLGVTPEELGSFQQDLAKEIAIKASKPTDLLSPADLSVLHDRVTLAMLDEVVHPDIGAYYLATIAEVAEEMKSEQLSPHEYSMKTADLALIHDEERQNPVNPDFRLPALQQEPWFLESPEDFQTQVTARVQLLAAVGVKLRGRLDDIVKNEALTMKKKEFKELIRCEGVWPSLCQIFQDLFEEDPEASGYFGIRLKMPNREIGDRDPEEDPANAPNILKRIDDYKTELRQKLEGQGYSRIDAKRAVAVAYNLLYIGDAIESADKGKNAGDFVTFNPSARVFYHPADQARGKWGIVKEGEEEQVGFDEDWGGNIGDWTISRREVDQNFRENLTRRQEIPPFTKLPFPETMMISLYEFIKINDDQGEEISLAQALLDGLDLESLNLEGLDPDVFATWRDSARTVHAFYKFLTNEGPQNNDFDFTDLRGTLSKLTNPKSKLPLQEVYSDPEYIAWCILGYYGLDLSTSTPLVSLHSLGIVHEMSYTHMLNLNAFRQLGISRKTLREVKRLTGALMLPKVRSIQRNFKAFFENF